MEWPCGGKLPCRAARTQLFFEPHCLLPVRRSVRRAPAGHKGRRIDTPFTTVWVQYRRPRFHNPMAFSRQVSRRQRAKRVSGSHSRSQRNEQACQWRLNRSRSHGRAIGLSLRLDKSNRRVVAILKIEYFYKMFLDTIYGKQFKIGMKICN